MRGLIWGGLAIAAGAMILPALVVAALGRQFLYHPTALDEGRLNQLAASPGWHRETLEVNTAASTVNLNGLVRPPTDKNAPWILVFGGNAQSLEAGFLELSMMAEGQDFGLAVFSYRGYDGSGGEPNQIHLVGDAIQVVQHIRENYQVEPSRISLVGQSLGSGIVTQVAARMARDGQPLRSVVLISPYRTMADVFNEKVPVIPIAYAVPDKYPTIDYIRNVQCPILVVHGEKDTLIPIHHAEALIEALPESQGQFIRLPNEGHNNLWTSEEMVSAIRDFLR